MELYAEQDKVRKLEQDVKELTSAQEACIMHTSHNCIYA